MTCFVVRILNVCDCVCVYLCVCVCVCVLCCICMCFMLHLCVRVCTYMCMYVFHAGTLVTMYHVKCVVSGIYVITGRTMYNVITRKTM